MQIILSENIFVMVKETMYQCILSRTVMNMLIVVIK